MGVYADRVLPHLVELTCRGAGFDRWRDDAAAGLAGRVVEIGFGSGLNVGRYPPAVEVVLAVEPSRVAKRIASRRVAASQVPVEYVGLDGQEIPLEDASCDDALCTFTLCTVPDASRALREVRRVLRPGGSLHFLEHGLADDPRVARWQRRFEPLQRAVAGGCHLTRRPDHLVRDAGFEMRDVSSRFARGPKPWCWFTVGVGVKAA